MKQIRIDQWLNTNGLAKSRTHAASLIEQQQIEIYNPTSLCWERVTKPSLKVASDWPRSHVKLLEGPANRYVSRGGLKLEGALEHLNFSVNGLRILDVGVSTGGFSDYCLKHSATLVVGVDVGHNQLSSELSQIQNFKSYEGINAKNLLSYKETVPELNFPFDLIIGDLSFISLTAVLPQLTPLLKTTGHILFLVKPQFELDSTALNKNGIVKDPHSYAIVKDKVIKACQTLNLDVEDYFPSKIEGKDGNKEFFLFAKA